MFHIGFESSTVGSPLSLGGKVLGGELADNRESQAAGGEETIADPLLAAASPSGRSLTQPSELHFLQK